jgi:hypothetical protein
MRKRLETRLTGYRSLSIIELVVRGKAAVEIRPLDHPLIERICPALRLGWRRKGMEAFGGKRSLTGPSPPSETPSAGSINANHGSLEPPAPRSDLLRNGRGELLPILPVL